MEDKFVTYGTMTFKILAQSWTNYVKKYYHNKILNQFKCFISMQFELEYEVEVLKKVCGLWMTVDS